VKRDRRRSQGYGHGSGSESTPKERNMATFIDIHEGFMGATQAQFEEAHRLDVEIQSQEHVSFDHAWLDPVSGKAFCLATGPNLASVVRVHERAGHPAKEVYELPISV
jgi:hypothetical protein